MTMTPSLVGYQQALAGTRFSLSAVRTMAGASRVLESQRPAAIVLDMHHRGELSWDLLTNFRQHPLTMHVPVIVIAAAADAQKALALGADVYGLEAGRRVSGCASSSRRSPASRARACPGGRRSGRVAIHRSRDPLRDEYEVIEASTGGEGLRQAQRVRPDCVVLDLHLGDIDGVDVRDALERDPANGGRARRCDDVETDLG